MPTKKKNIKPDIDTDIDLEVDELIKNNPKLAKYIDELKKAKKSSRISNKTGRSNDRVKGKVSMSTGSSRGKTSAKNFSLFLEIKKHPLFKLSNRDKRARMMIDEYREENKNLLTSKRNITPGQLVLFKYLNPKTKEELEYYDASPCTIFFGVFNSSQGRRVLGFNTHYFPPQIRYRIMEKIYKMYKPVYTKYFEKGATKELDGFDYRYLTEELEKHDLSFAVRMYIPQLIGDTFIVPPEMWPTALMTEGWFKKETRAAIMNYFKKDAKSKGKMTTGAHSKGKKSKKK